MEVDEVDSMANDPMLRGPNRQKAPVTQWFRARAYNALRHVRLFLVGRASMTSVLSVSCWTCIKYVRLFLVGRASMPTVSCWTCINADRFLLDVHQCRPSVSCWTCINAVCLFFYWTCVNAAYLFHVHIATARNENAVTAFSRATIATGTR